MLSASENGIAGLGMQRVLHYDTIGLAHAHRPGDPTDEAVDRVSGPGLREREVVPLAGELVGSVLQAVRPGDKHLPTAGGGHVVLAVTVDELAAARAVRTESGADLNDDDALVPRRNLDLFA